MNKEASKIFEAIKRLEYWFEQNGFSGWDPYDVQDSKIFRFIEQNFSNTIRRVLIRLLSEFNHIFPITFRKIAGVEKAINNKGLGLMLSAYSTLYQVSKNSMHLNNAISVASYLEQNSNKDYTGMSWGYPFDWLSPILIPAEVPSSVVTSIVGDGFYRLYQATNDKKYLNICQEICKFFINDLSLTYQDAEKSAICFSYTPLDDYQVHNANLFVAEFLIRIGMEIENKSFVDKGILSAHFALKEQQKEGYLPYWGLSQTTKYSRGKIHTDHYHCGFEIRSLHSIWLLTKNNAFNIAYQSYYQWYKKNMFCADGLPKYTTKSFYPLDIHTCAEAILCNTHLAKDKDDLRFVVNVATDVLNRMEFGAGEFTHVVREIVPFVKIHSKIPMLRWGQAWMFLALVDLYRATNKYQSINLNEQIGESDGFNP